MTDVVTLMSAGVRVGAAQAIVADLDDVVALGVSDEIDRAVLSMPPHAARHLAERLILKAAEVERMAALTDELPCVPRPEPAPDVIAPMG